MNIQITEDAVDWFKSEYELDEGIFRLFVRYGGVGGRIPGFSLGVTMESPIASYASITSNHITFFIEESDAWYFDEHDLHISLDEETSEPRFTYQ